MMEMKHLVLSTHSSQLCFHIDLHDVSLCFSCTLTRTCNEQLCVDPSRDSPLGIMITDHITRLSWVNYWLTVNAKHSSGLCSLPWIVTTVSRVEWWSHHSGRVVCWCFVDSTDTPYTSVRMLFFISLNVHVSLVWDQTRLLLVATG